MKMRSDFIVILPEIQHIVRTPKRRDMEKLTIQKIELPNQRKDNDLIERLYDMGLHPGLEIEVIGKISFNSVTIVQFGTTRIALNAEEFSCLHGR